MRQVISAVRDLIIRFLPESIIKQIIKKADYAFIVHPRSIGEVKSHYHFLKYLPEHITRFITKHMWPVAVSNIEGPENLTGYLIGLLMLPEDILADRKLTCKKISDASGLAHKLGCPIIGLGAFLPSASKGGSAIADKVDNYITTGHAFTVSIIGEMINRLNDMLESREEDISIAILGAAGLTGESLSGYIISRNRFKKVYLIDRPGKKHNLDKIFLRNKSENTIETSTSLNNLKKANLIVVLTSSTSCIVTENNLSAGTVLIDDTHPRNTHQSLADREDILTLDVVVTAQGIRNNFPKSAGLDSNEAFPCLAEAMILSAKGYQGNYSVGVVGPRKIEEIGAWGREFGFWPVFKSFGNAVGDERLERFKAEFIKGVFRKM